MLLHSDGTNEAEVIVLDGGSGNGDGGVLERVGLGGVCAEVAKVVAFVIGKNYGRCLCLEKKAVEEVGMLAIEA